MSLVTDLRAKTGASFVECRDALAACDNDMMLAQGWLRYNGIAVRVKPKEGQSDREAYNNYIMKLAREWVEENSPAKE